MKKYSRNLLLFSLLILQHFLLCAQENEKIATLKVSAIGRSKESATQNALRSAIEQSFGTYLSSKTVISNDNLVSDEIVSISSGNIRKYTILNETMFSDTSWSVFLFAEVSIDKLQKFVQSKGYEVEMQGGLFSMNINQQILNEKSEIKAIDNIVSILHSAMQTAFDFEIQSEQPQSLDAQNLNWQIKHTVSAVANNNMSTAANFMIKNLSDLSMKPEEVDSYKSLTKPVYEVAIKTGNFQKSFYLRKFESILILNILSKQFNYYIRNFYLQSDVSKHYGSDYSQVSDHEIRDKWLDEGQLNKVNRRSYYEQDNYRAEWGRKMKIGPRDILVIYFFEPSQNVAKLYFNEKMSLEQLGKVKAFKIDRDPSTTSYRNGGYVLFENDTKFVVVSPYSVNNYKYDNFGNNKNNERIEGNPIDLNFNFNLRMYGSRVPELVGKKILFMGHDDWTVPGEKTTANMARNLNVAGLFGLILPRGQHIGFNYTTKQPTHNGCDCQLLLLRDVPIKN